MTVLSGLDAAGRRRSPATLPGHHAGRPPRHKGMRYPADPPTIDEIVAVMRHTSHDRHGWRVGAMIVVLWRAGLRIQEALALAEHDLDQRRGSILIRNGKGGRRREVGMDEWGWEQLRPWLTSRLELPVGPLFCIIDGPTRGRPWSGAPCAASSAGSPCGRASDAACASPAASRPRARTRPRGRAAEHHPTAARSCEPRHDFHLPPRHRPGGDNRDGPHAPGTDDVRQRRPAALRRMGGSAPALPLRHGEASVRTPRSGRVVLVPCGSVPGAIGDARCFTGAVLRSRANAELNTWLGLCSRSSRGEAARGLVEQSVA
jgi:hypothetical protein